MTKKSDETKAADNPAKDKNAKKGEKKAAAGKDSETMTRREKRTIPCKLDDKEISKLAKEYAQTKRKIALLESEQKAAVDRFKGDAKLLEASAAEVLGYIDSGERSRELEVDVIYDWRTNEVRVVRVDTQEEITKRAMSAEERQREMFDISHRKDKSEVKNAKKGGTKLERGNPQPHDVIDVETREGWKRGKVQPSSGSMLDVDVGDGKIESVPVESSLWRWPDEVGENSAPAKNLPKVGDTIRASGYDGWHEGKVSKVDGKRITVDVGDDEVIEVDLDSDDWEWPETLKASVGEQVEAKSRKGKAKKGKKSDDDEIPPMPGEEGLSF